MEFPVFDLAGAELIVDEDGHYYFLHFFMGNDTTPLLINWYVIKGYRHQVEIRHYPKELAAIAGSENVRIF